MAKAVNGLVYETLRRHCVLCNEVWTAPHPQDRNIFCPKCQAVLKDMVMQKRGEDDGEV